jgi:hypothetical protein
MTAATDPVGALRYAQGRVGTEELKRRGHEAMRVMKIYEDRLDRVFEVAVSLPDGEGFHRDLTEDFLKWQAFAPEQADECLRGLPATHPLRQAVEAKLAGKEEK